MTSEKKSRSKPVEQRRSAAAFGGNDDQGMAATAVERRQSESKWHEQEQAAFHISLDRVTGGDEKPIWRTHATRLETDVEHVWQGVPGQGLIDWMLDQAGVAVVAAEPHEEASAAGEQETPEAEPLARRDLSITGVEVEERPALTQPASAAARKWMRARVSLEIASRTASPIGQPTDCLIYILSYEREIGKATVLATAVQPLCLEGLNDTATLDFELPPVGNYQLLANVVLPDRDLAAVELGPELEVVP